MKTYKLITALALAAALIAITAALIAAAPLNPRHAYAEWLLNAPINPHTIIKPHSDEWNNRYFDQNVADTLPYYFETTSREQLRGGLAGINTRALAPIKPQTVTKAHSDAWNARYFDRNVNSTLPINALEYQSPALRRGGMAKDAH